MLISEETKEQLNLLLGDFFGHNSEADNLAYNLADSCYPNISTIYHKSFAHFFTGDEMADGISDLMDLLDARPVRKAVSAHEVNYNGDIKKIFFDNLEMCDRCRSAIIKGIELAEMNEDVEVKIYLEELLMKFMPYRKQASVWAKYAERYENDYKSFNIHFNDITTYIPII